VGATCNWRRNDLLAGIVDGVLRAVADSAYQAILVADCQFGPDRE
jgi:hypothetical protein